MVDSLEAERLVLESWKKERAELDAAIAVLEKKIAARTGPTITSSNGAQIGTDEFFRLSTTEAIKKFLKIVGKPARATTDIIGGLKRGGSNTASYTNIYTSLGRLQKRKEVVKVGDNWGLEEWYPPASSASPKLKSLMGSFQEAEVTPDIEAQAETAETPKEQKEGEVPAPGRKQVVADFLAKNGPSTRSEILAGTDIPEGTISYCLKDVTRFVRDDDGKWRNVE